MSEDSTSILKLIDGLDLENYTFIRKDTLWILVRSALRLEEITLARGAEILGLPLEIMRDVANQWYKEVGIESSDDLTPYTGIE